MTGKDAIDHWIKPEKKKLLGKCLGGVALLLVLAAWGCSGGGDKGGTAKKDQQSAPETVATPPVPPKPVESVPSQPAPAAPVAKVAPAPKPISTFHMTPEEFRLGFNKFSELEKSKLRIKPLAIMAGAEDDTFRHVFNENLYLSGKVNKADGALLEVTLNGVLDGSMATTVDLNVSIGSIVKALSPKVPPAQREAILNGLGISNKVTDIYNLDKKITRNGVTYWVKSSRKSGLRFGAKSVGD